MGPPNVLLANIEFVVTIAPVLPVGPVSLYGRIISRAIDTSSSILFSFLS
ncbi:hypothetical protein ACQGSX_26915 [Bacillus sp. GMs2/1]